MLGAHKEESFSPMLGLGVNLFPRRFIFRAGIKVHKVVKQPTKEEPRPRLLTFSELPKIILLGKRLI